MGWVGFVSKYFNVYRLTACLENLSDTVFIFIVFYWQYTLCGEAPVKHMFHVVCITPSIMKNK